MTPEDQAEYDRGQALLQQAKPRWLQQMAPDSPIALPPIPERRALFNMGMTPIALDGDSSGGGGGATASFTGIVISNGILRYAEVNGTLGAIIT